ncbi:MAG: radical SAM protein [Candidatus Omnitrophica bacterium]|nr:radical SAM protein [Candidatus Omnitrophota bacterium]
MPNKISTTPLTHGERYRSVLKDKKPRVYQKIQEYLADLNSPQRVCSIDIAYDWSCNMQCTHCFTTLLQDKTRRASKFTLESLKKVCDEADAMGVFAISLQGGEPLFWGDLEDIIRTIGPDRFTISIVTNGVFLDKPMAEKLKALGVDRMCLSIDSGNAREHDRFRNYPGSFQKCMEAVDHCLAIGLTPHIHTVVTHTSLYSDGFNYILKYSKERNLGITVLIAIPAGEWCGNTSDLITEEDAKYIQKLHEQYPLLRRDITAVNNVDTGCRAVSYALYITAEGEVLPCPFLHFTLGNAFVTPLKDILAKGHRVKEFHDYSPKCLAGEDKDFIKKYMSKTFGVKDLPLKVEDVFSLDPLE